MTFVFLFAESNGAIFRTFVDHLREMSSMPLIFCLNYCRSTTARKAQVRARLQNTDVIRRMDWVWL